MATHLQVKNQNQEILSDWFIVTQQSSNRTRAILDRLPFQYLLYIIKGQVLQSPYGEIKAKEVTWMTTKAFRIIESDLVNVEKDLKIRSLGAV